jgi:hypothetical protein
MQVHKSKCSLATAIHLPLFTMRPTMRLKLLLLREKKGKKKKRERMNIRIVAQFVVIHHKPKPHSETFVFKRHANDYKNPIKAASREGMEKIKKLFIVAILNWKTI